MVEQEPLLPWRDAASDRERRELMKAAGVSRWPRQLQWMPRGVRSIMAAPPGSAGGRIGWGAKVDGHMEATSTARVLYPWVTSRPLPVWGPLFGRDLFAGSHFAPDFWRLRQAKLLDGLGIFASGLIGSGKTSCAKTLALRNVEFGRGFVVPGDIRGEWVPVAQAVGGQVLQLGPGMPHRLNMLSMPRKPAGVPDDQWWSTVRTHWEELLVAVVETVRRDGAVLNSIETTGIELALDEATRVREASGKASQLAPIWPQKIVDLLLEPSQYMATEMHMTVEELRGQLRNVGLDLRKLTKGSLQGLVDAKEGSSFDPRSPGIVVDLSRVQTSDAAVALVMGCVQSSMELIWAHQTYQRLAIYDEWWRMASFESLIQRQVSGVKLARKTGAATMVISHRMKERLGSARAQAAGQTLIDDCAVKIHYRHLGDEIESGSLGDIPEAAGRLLPELQQGQALWMLGDKPYIVQHYLSPSERRLVESDQAMGDEYRSLSGRSGDELWAGDEALVA